MRFSIDKYSAFLFDCDGTIADSMPIHLQAWNEALRPWQVEISWEDHQLWAGRTTARIVEILNERERVAMPVAAVVLEKELAYLRLIPAIRPVASVLETIETYRGQLPFAVVSGSPHASVVKTLTHLGLIDDFPVILGAEDYLNGKPAPDCFLKAASLLVVEPSRCLVFEDGELGIEGARSAGMNFVRVAPDATGFDWSGSRF